MVEEDILVGDTILIAKDVYNLTIAVNLSNQSVSPAMFNFCLKQCFQTFFMQTLMSFLFFYDFRSMDNFQPLTLIQTSQRLMIFMILHLNTHEKFHNAWRMLTYLKRCRG